MAHGCVAVAFSDENVAVRQRDDVVGLIERSRIGYLVGGIAARFAERKQHFALRTEFDHLMSDDFGRGRRKR
jgi:hypothetical protein